MIKLEQRHKEIFLFGLAMGILILVFQLFSYRARFYTLDEWILFGIGITCLGVGTWLGSRYVHRFKQKERKLGSAEPSSFGLSSREMEVLLLLAEGLSNQEIADRLFVSSNTIKTHLSNIFSKLHVQRRTQAIQKARENLLIS